MCVTDDVTACKEQKRDLLQYTHTEKCNLFVLYNKNLNGFWGIRKEKQVCWRGLYTICVCVLYVLCIDHGQQPMKMHTEVTLFYNKLQNLSSPQMLLLREELKLGIGGKAKACGNIKNKLRSRVAMGLV